MARLLGTDRGRRSGPWLEIPRQSVALFGLPVEQGKSGVRQEFPRFLCSWLEKARA